MSNLQSPQGRRFSVLTNALLGKVTHLESTRLYSPCKLFLCNKEFKILTPYLFILQTIGSRGMVDTYLLAINKVPRNLLRVEIFAAKIKVKYAAKYKLEECANKGTYI